MNFYFTKGGGFIPFSLLFLLSFLSGLGSKSQDSILKTGSPSDRVEILFSKKHISFCIIPNIAEKATVVRNSEMYNMHAAPQRSLEVGLNYHTNFNPKSSFIIGIHGGLVGRNTLFRVEKEAFDPQLQDDIVSEGLLSREFDVTYLSVPIVLQRRWIKSKANFWNIDIGINIRYSMQNLIASEGWAAPSGNTYRDFYNLQLAYGNNKKPWIDYNLGGGHSWTLKNNDILQASLLANLSFTEFVKGTYQFTLPNKPVESGTYGIKGSYIGASFNYVLTGAKKKIRKLNLKN